MQWDWRCAVEKEKAFKVLSHRLRFAGVQSAGLALSIGCPLRLEGRACEVQRSYRRYHCESIAEVCVDVGLTSGPWHFRCLKV